MSQLNFKLTLPNSVTLRRMFRAGLVSCRIAAYAMVTNAVGAHELNNTIAMLYADQELTSNAEQGYDDGKYLSNSYTGNTHTHEVNHQTHAVGKATVVYLGNEAVLVTDGTSKVLFDPFFHKDYGRFQRVPLALSRAMHAGEPPYDDIDAILISHAHGDHFSAEEVVQYLQQHTQVQLIAPEQAIVALKNAGLPQAALQRIHGLKVAFEPAISKIILPDLTVQAMPIPHAGWPSFQDVDNFIYRVELASSISVMHLGDADDKTQHFLPFQTPLKEQPTHLGMPPFWFFYSEEGQHIVDNILNTKNSIAIHVPVAVPRKLRASGRAYFSEPGKQIEVVAEDAN